MAKTDNAAKSAIDPDLARAILADFKLGSALGTIARRRHVSKATVRRLPCSTAGTPPVALAATSGSYHREAAERANALPAPVAVGLWPPERPTSSAT